MPDFKTIFLVVVNGNLDSTSNDLGLAISRFNQLTENKYMGLNNDNIELYEAKKLK